MQENSKAVMNYGREIELPKTLYHYTSLEGFLGVLDHRTQARFLSTRCDFLNDSEEFTAGCNLALDYLGTLDSHIASLVRKRLNRDDPELPRPWVLSFSTKRDATQMWMTYTKKEGGFAIGVDSSRLVKDLETYYEKCRFDDDAKEDGMFASLGAYLGKCIYIKKGDACNPEFTAMLDYVFQRDMKPEDYMSERYLKYCARHILRIVALVKRDDYKFENEWRLVQMFDAETAAEWMKFVGDKPRMSYHRCIKQDTVKEVVVSPNGSKDKFKIIANLIKRKHGYRYSVSPSDSSYVG